MKCSYYNGAFDESSTEIVDVFSVLMGIGAGKWKERIEKIRNCDDDKERNKMKWGLPAPTFSGTFKQTMEPNKKGIVRPVSRLDKNIDSYTGIVIIDIDIKKESEIKRIKSMLLEDPYVFSFFLSPSGGLKILYVVNSGADNHKMFGFPQVKEWVEDNYNVPVDSSGKNISRLCFVSYDPEIYINREYTIFHIDTSKLDFEPVITYDPERIQTSNNIDHIFDVCKSWIEDKGYNYRKGSRNNYLHIMACYLNRAGLTHNQISDVIMKNHAINKDMFSELESTIKGVVSRNSHEWGRLKIYEKKSNTIDIFKSNQL